MKLKISYDVGPTGAWFDLRYSFEVARKAEKAGFDAIWYGDHFLPWFHTHAHSPQAWIWLATAAQLTRRIPVGSDVTVPMFKYHPMVVAQAFATLARINPGRVLLGVGTGEAMNESPFIREWPPWRVRGEMLGEAVELIKMYWTEKEYFDFHGKHFQVKSVHCYDRPTKRIPIYWSAFGPKSASLGGKHADHVMTSGTPEYVRDNVFRMFSDASSKKIDDIEKCVYVDGGYGDVKKLIAKYRFNAGSLIPENFDERDPRRIEASTKKLTDQWIMEKTCLMSSSEQLIEIIEKYRRAGMNHFIFGDWGYDPLSTIAMFKQKVLPHYGVGTHR